MCCRRMIGMTCWNRFWRGDDPEGIVKRVRLDLDQPRRASDSCASIVLAKGQATSLRIFAAALDTQRLQVGGVVATLPRGHIAVDPVAR